MNCSKIMEAGAQVAGTGRWYFSGTSSPSYEVREVRPAGRPNPADFSDISAFVKADVEHQLRAEALRNTPTGILSKQESVSRETRQTRRAAAREQVKALGRRGRSISRRIAITDRKIRQTQKVLSL